LDLLGYEDVWEKLDLLGYEDYTEGNRDLMVLDFVQYIVYLFFFQYLKYDFIF